MIMITLPTVIAITMLIAPLVLLMIMLIISTHAQAPKAQACGS